MRFLPLLAGRFVRRVNRFRITATLDGEAVDAHLPNSGRLTELLTPGRLCWLSPAGSPSRKTDFDLKLVEYAGVLVSVDARLPNPLFAEALEEGRLAPFQAVRDVRREVQLGESRIDFGLEMPDGDAWVETKSVTLVEDGRALFPDAPTARGKRHVGTLVDAMRQGSRCAVVFVVQRPDAEVFAPHEAADPAFTDALRDAAGTGVELYAWNCRVSRQAIGIDRQIPVELT